MKKKLIKTVGMLITLDPTGINWTFPICKTADRTVNSLEEKYNSA